MYRVLMGNDGKVADASFKAGAAMEKGMLVKKGTDGKTAFVAATTDKDVFFVGKELIPTGINGDRDLPDYSDVFENIVANEFVTLEKPVSGEEYFTNQYTGAVAVDGYLTVGTDGLLVALATGTSKFVVKSTNYVDGGNHAGIIVGVLD